MPPKKQEQQSLIRVPVGPFGLLGYKMMTPRQFERRQAAETRRRERKARNKKYTGGNKKTKKQENWIIPGILKW